MAKKKKDKILVARIVDAFGVRGWVKLFSFTEEISNLLNFQNWFLEIPKQGVNPYQVSASQLHGRYIVAKLKGVSDRDEALKLKGASVYIDPDSLPKLEIDEYYWHELIGLQVVDVSGVVYGVVNRIMETGANDVLVAVGEKTTLIPYISDVIQKIDLDDSVIQVDWFEDF